MSKADLLVERGAARLEELSRKAAAKGGFASRLADELAEDAAFLRQLKPSLIRARAKGRPPGHPVPNLEPQAPTAPETTAPQTAPETTAPQTSSGPQLTAPPRRMKPKATTNSGRRRKGPNPFVVAGAAFATGIVLAKLIDWRGHAHPRD